MIKDKWIFLLSDFVAERKKKVFVILRMSIKKSQSVTHL